MQNRSTIVAVVVFIALMAVVMAVVSVKLSPLDKSDAAFVVEDSYVGIAMPSEGTAVAFMVLTNRTGRDDRLVAATSALSGRVTLRRQGEGDAGAAPTHEISGGIALPDGAHHRFAPGGDHLLFTGLTTPLIQGDIIAVTLEFERAGDVAISVPVDLDR